MREYQVRICEGLGVKFPGPCMGLLLSRPQIWLHCFSFLFFGARGGVHVARRRLPREGRLQLRTS